MGDAQRLADVGAGRQSTEDLLMGRIREYEEYARGFIILKNTIPWKTLTKGEEEALWHFFCRMRLP